MCTVSYIPKKDGFILTSNRDESLFRPQSLEPEKHFLFGQEILFPKDPEANGTWIATSDKGRTVCLLNGGFERHIHLPQYRLSRGLVVLDYFKFSDAETFSKAYDFEGIAPFTLVIVEENSVRKLSEIRWTGESVYHKEMDSEKQFIWSSVTLYSHETIAARANWFINWLSENQEPTYFEILDFHHFAGGSNNQNSLVMQRPDHKQTISITQVQQMNGEKVMRYEDLLVHEMHQLKI